MISVNVRRLHWIDRTRCYRVIAIDETHVHMDIFTFQSAGDAEFLLALVDTHGNEFEERLLSHSSMFAVDGFEALGAVGREPLIVETEPGVRRGVETLTPLMECTDRETLDAPLLDPVRVHCRLSTGTILG